MDVVVEDDDPLFLIYTSGTTGRPKGAVLTHANCFWTNTAIDRLMDVTTFDVVLQVLPQFHVGGWNVQPLLAWWKGATVVLEPSFDPGRALRLIEEKRVTTMMGVPANYLFMAEHPSFATTDLSSLRMAVVGGAPMPESLIETWTARGVSLVQGYGLSEASPNVLGLPPEYVKEKVGYAGKAYPHVEVALEGSDGSLIDGPGTGELLVRGPQRLRRLLERPGGDRRGDARGGCTRGTSPNGCRRLLPDPDRIKDMYISGGENVYPAEVESVLMAHPDVVEAGRRRRPRRAVGRGRGGRRRHPPTAGPRGAAGLVPGKARQVQGARECPVSSTPSPVGMNKVLKREIVEMLEAQR